NDGGFHVRVINSFLSMPATIPDCNSFQRIPPHNDGSVHNCRSWLSAIHRQPLSDSSKLIGVMLPTAQRNSSIRGNFSSATQRDHYNLPLTIDGAPLPACQP